MPDYTVYLALRDEDLPSLAEAAQEAFDPERLAVITELTVGGEEGPVELGLTMSANSPGEAGRFGEEAYARLRETAGLSLAAPNVVGVASRDPHPREPRHFELRRVADSFLEDGRADFAVIAAQTACEVFMEFAMSELLRARASGPLADIIPQLLKGFSPSDQRTQVVWAALTGERLQQAQFWSQYAEHLRRRNDVVHRGAHVSAEAAAASLEAADALMDYVAEAWRRTS